MTVVLAAKDIYRFFTVDGAKVPVLRGVSFALEKGNFTTIMGPSGSGKSTLLNILCGLDQPSVGEIELMGESLAKASESRRTTLRRLHVGYIFQLFNLSPDMTVWENVILPLLIAGERPEAHEQHMNELLDALGIAKIRDRQPGGLSGGEMQRVSIARSLVRRPPLLLADEPTGNLSSKAGEEIVAMLKDVATRYQTTVLLVTHNPRDAAAGDRVLFLHDGALRQNSELTGGPFDVADVFHRLQELGI
ncbi:MAG: ABC transporter ATP-binding protein [Planctomycetes bacterium]|nr:ABC transporter ATP-binding protein [Planctomycetota bacterium]